MDFLVKKECKFYWHPIKSNDKNIQEENEKEINGLEFTKTVLSYNSDIIANLILDQRRKNKKIVNFKIYCDKGIWKSNKIGVFIKDSEFNIYLPQEEKINQINYDGHYEFDVEEIKPTNILHQCADIISGIARENFNLNYLDRSKAYQLLLNNRFADIVETPYT